MEIRVLRYFLTVVREESITKAAEVLHITQPTLSRQLAQLEEEMGVKLFVRGTRKIFLTNHGLLLRRRAEEILELVDKTEKELIAQEENIEGVVSIGCGDLAAVQLIPKLIEKFHQLYPRVSFDLYTATADHVRDRMEQGRTDVGILLEPITPALVQNEIHPYYQESEVIKYIHSLGIAVQGWYPLGGRGYTAELLGDEVISEIAKAHGKSSAQVILRWNLQKGVIVIPGSSNPDHIQENTELYDFQLTQEEMEKINALNRDEKHDWY